MSETYDQPILFVDVETTGLNARDHYLLEIAVILTDTEGHILGHFVALPDTISERALQRACDPYVYDMHKKTGLWERREQAREEGSLLSLNEIDAIIYGMLFDQLVERNSVRIAGNSPRLDLDFIEHYLPTFSKAWLSHRFFDMTGIETFLQMHTGIEPYDGMQDENCKHQAFYDVQQCVEQYKYWRSHCVGLVAGLKQQLKVKGVDA